MVDEFEEMFKKLNKKRSSFLSYQEIYDAFEIGIEQNVGEGKKVEAIKKNSELIIVKFYMPVNGIFEVFDHDCREETIIVLGKVRETVLGVEYCEFEKLRIAKGVPHGLLAIEETIGYSVLYNPN